MEIKIDLGKLETKQDIWLQIKKLARFPSSYDGSLDELYEFLVGVACPNADSEEEYRFIFINRNHVNKKLSIYVNYVIFTIEEVAEITHKIDLVVYDEEEENY